jgi:competence protein ComEA
VSTPTPTPPPVHPHADSRAARATLVAFGVTLLTLVAVRTYGPRVGVRPSEVVAAPVDVNAADPAELRQLPGVGPALARRIAGHGPFASAEQLQDVPGVGDKTLDRLRPHVTAHPGSPSPVPDAERLERKPVTPPPVTAAGKLRRGDPPVNVNTADVATLQRLPAVGPTLAARIAEARADGPFKSIEDLRRVKGIGAKTLEALRPVVICE